MIDVIRLVIFTVVAIGAITNIYIELKNLKKVYSQLYFYQYS